MSITQKQKAILSSYFPELGAVAQQSNNSPTTEALVVALINKIESLKGERGTDGKTPKRGEDYLTDSELEQIIKYIRDSAIPEEMVKKATPKKGVHYFDGKDGKDGKDGRDGRPGRDGDKGEKGDIGLTGRPGKDGSADSAIAIINKINTLKGKALVDVSIIDGAVNKEELGQYEKKLLDGMAKVDGRIKLIDQRWHGGGLSRVSHDSTLTGDGTPSNPLSVVGGQGSGYQSPIGLVNSSNTIFIFATAPNAIVVDGVNYRKTQSDGTINWSGTTIITLLTTIPNYDIYAVA